MTGSSANTGDRIELIAVTDGYLPFALSAGDRGTVAFTDSLGTVHIRWDSGKQVGILAEDTDLIRAVPGQDRDARPGPSEFVTQKAVNQMGEGTIGRDPQYR